MTPDFNKAKNYDSNGSSGQNKKQTERIPINSEEETKESRMLQLTERKQVACFEDMAQQVNSLSARSRTPVKEGSSSGTFSIKLQACMSPDDKRNCRDNDSKKLITV